MLGADDDLVAWLLEGDPSIRWRVHRDLLSSSDATVRAERAKVATEGWGAKLISLQEPDGRWGGGDYTPKWISTTYTLLHLLWLGLQPGNPTALAGCERLWEWQSKWRAPETCIVSMLVRLTAAHRYPAERLDAVVDYLLGQQLDDGGWNCAARHEPGKHSSFHTSIQALEALHAYQYAGGRATEEAGVLPAPPAVQVTSHGPDSNPWQHPLSTTAPVALRRAAWAGTLHRCGCRAGFAARRCHRRRTARASSERPLANVFRISRP
jgi:hypothetical protein